MQKSLEEQVAERLLAQSLIPSNLQKLFWAAYDDEVLFAEEFLGMELHPGQKKWLRNAKKKINLLNPANRWGKTVIVAIRHIHRNFYKKGVPRGNTAGWQGQTYQTVNLAPLSSQTEQCFTYTKQILTSTFPIPQPDGSVRVNHCLIKWFYDERRTQNTAPFAIYYTNNSSTEFRSTSGDRGDSIAAKPYGYISYDEGGRSHHLKSEMENTLLARLADWRGQLDIPSTPNSDSPSILDHYEMYQWGLDPNNPLYYTQEGDLDDNIFLSREAREEQKLTYANSPKRDQVLHGKFIFSGSMVFSADEILKSKDVTLSIKREEPYKKDHVYMISIDTSIGSDSRVYTVLDYTHLKYDVYAKKWFGHITQVAKRAVVGNSMSPQLHMFELLDLYDTYNQVNNVKIALETFNGESARFYMDMPRNLQHVTTCYGSWQPPVPPGAPKKKQQAARLVKKADIIVSLKKALSAFLLRRPADDDEGSRQLQIYKEDDDKIPNDHTISLALGVYFVTDGKPKNRATGETATVEW